jgi:protocatechuate 4,5-dioxygenase alpha chain
MRNDRDYSDIPGTYVFDPHHCMLGYELNMFCMTLNKAENRDEFRANEETYLTKFQITEAQRQAVLDRNWLEMLRLGGNIYFTFKIAIFDGLSMQKVGGLMSGVSEEEFKNMMISGGRSPENNRYKAD